MGYLTHCVLGELFGDLSPRPFALRGNGRGGAGRIQTVLGYARASAADLRQRAMETARPDAWEAVDLETLASKPMPDQWPETARFSFEVRCCPVVRMAGSGPRHRK